MCHNVKASCSTANTTNTYSGVGAFWCIFSDIGRKKKTLFSLYMLSSTFATNAVQFGLCPTNNYNTGVFHRSHVLKLVAKKRTTPEDFHIFNF